MSDHKWTDADVERLVNSADNLVQYIARRGDRWQNSYLFKECEAALAPFQDPDAEVIEEMAAAYARALEIDRREFAESHTEGIRAALAAYRTYEVGAL